MADPISGARSSARTTLLASPWMAWVWARGGGAGFPPAGGGADSEVMVATLRPRLRTSQPVPGRRLVDVDAAAAGVGGDDAARDDRQPGSLDGGQVRHQGRDLRLEVRRPPVEEPQARGGDGDPHAAPVDGRGGPDHRVRSGAAGKHYTSAGALPMIPGVDGVGRLPDGRPAMNPAMSPIKGCS
jgi:hypothetical protein